MSGPEERLTDIEIALTHQQALVEDLNAIVADQADRIDRLSLLVSRLAERLASLEAGGADSIPADRPPPHW